MKTAHKAGSPEQGNGHRQGGVVAGAKGLFSDITKEAMKVEGKILDGAQQKGQEAWKRTSTWIAQNPASAVGAAFVAGVVMKALFARNKK